MNSSPEFYMRLAMRAADKARGFCSPNPFVGALIVKNGQIIASGYTQCYGSDHAEVQAIKKAGRQAKGADIYVTLEPCSHYGKTPPCALAIIEAGIKRCFIGIIDPNPLVSGKGIQMLQDAGLDVHLGTLEPQVSRQLESHLCFTQKLRPFVTLKTALSLDGKYAARDGSSQWITSEKSRRRVHRTRSQHDAVITGISTVVIDDPMLNVRLAGKIHQPLRVIIDPSLEIPLSSKIVNSLKDFPTLIICAKGHAHSAIANELQKRGAELRMLDTNDGLFTPAAILDILFQMQICSVLLETGSGLAESFIQARLVDKFLFFFGPLILGGDKSPYPHLGIENINAALRFAQMDFKRMDNDIMVTAYPKF